MRQTDNESYAMMPQSGLLLTNEPLASYTTWRVGGPAQQLYKPASIEDLSQFLQGHSALGPLLFLGLGSNLLIRDGGYPGTIVLTQGALMGIELLDDNRVRVEAGVSCATMARFCARNNLVGAEFLAGIPGTVGGALRMNAGCFDSETWEWVEAVEMVSLDGSCQHYKPTDFEIAYRHVRGPKDAFFVAATFKLRPGDKAASLLKIKEWLAHRARTQPTSEYNCGSVFRNPEGDYAARLIESAGLKGKQIGHAMVSTKHANFIINQEGKASAQDIEDLIGHVQDTVLAQTKISLVCEVHIIGENT